LKKAFYAGSFDPWHQGHDAILKKILMVFDKVVVACGINPDKERNLGRQWSSCAPPWEYEDHRIECRIFKYQGYWKQI